MNGRGEEFTVLLEGVLAAPGDQIESLAFGPERKLYVSTGDAFLPDRAQNTDALVGAAPRVADIVSPNGMVFYRETGFPPAFRGKLFLVFFGDTFSSAPR